MRGLQVVSERIARACTSSACSPTRSPRSTSSSASRTPMLFVPEGSAGRLVALASRGYGEAGIGGEVAFGEGLVGTVAERRRMVRLAGVAGELRLRPRDPRPRAARSTGGCAPRSRSPACRTPRRARLPLLVADELVGVLAVESRDPLAFDEWDEAFLQVVGNQIAIGIERMQEDDEEALPAARPAGAPAPHPAPRRSFVYYRNDDCVFVDGEYLIRNVPAKILWKLLRQHRRDRTARVHQPRAAPRPDPRPARATEGQPREPADPAAPTARGEVPRRASAAGAPRPLRARARRRARPRRARFCRLSAPARPRSRTTPTGC
jgi:adenylate cyclase